MTIARVARVLVVALLTAAPLGAFASAEAQDRDPAAAPASASASAPASAPTDSGCTYEQCALGIAPVWNGLALVRGASGARVANLAFFWPTSLHHALPGADSAAWYGVRAVRVRRQAAVLTDAGAVLILYGLGRSIARGPAPDDARVAMALGAAGLGVSLPLHFVADGHLSRAVWWHNRRYAR